MNAVNLDTAETAWAQGVWLNGRYVNPSEILTCPRCGWSRLYRTGRPTDPICRDCRAVERDTAKHVAEPLTGRVPVKRPGGIVRFEPVPEPLSTADMAWCLAQEERHFWDQWRHQARTVDHPPMQSEAERRARTVSDSTLAKSGERVFDESATTTEGVA